MISDFCYFLFLSFALFVIYTFCHLLILSFALFVLQLLSLNFSYLHFLCFALFVFYIFFRLTCQLRIFGHLARLVIHPVICNFCHLYFLFCNFCHLNFSHLHFLYFALFVICPYCHLLFLPPLFLIPDFGWDLYVLLVL